MSLSMFAAFWAVSFLFIITPGVDWAFVISAGLRRKRVIPAVTGLLSGHMLATLVVAAGVGTLMAGTPAILTALTVAGAAYLLWLGIGMLRNPPVPTGGQDEEAASPARWMVKGLCISGLNPKVLLLFLALLPQFTDVHAAWPVSLQMIALGILHVLSCAVVYLIVGYSSRAALQNRPAAARCVGRISGAMMVGIALLLLAGKLI